MPDFTDEHKTPGIPKVMTLETCEFPIVEGNIAGYKVLRLPEELRRLFDTDGVSVVRINSQKLAHLIPDYGGKGSGEYYSQLPHQDHLDPFGDKRRFLMLSKLSEGARGSSTLIMSRAVALQMLPFEEAWVKDHRLRTLIGDERNYDKRFRLTEKQYDDCFDTLDGYERAVAAVAGRSPSTEREIAIRLGILNYLIRGPSADVLLQEALQKSKAVFFEERWEVPGIVIIDNLNVFHARLGGNIVPLKRNFCI